MQKNGPLYLDVAQCVEHIVSVFGNDIKIGMPLGLGKPVPLLNALYRRAKENPEMSLTVFTALSLEKPTWNNDLERRFLEPFVARVWGGVPDIEFLLDIRKGALPPNVHIHELFFKAGTYRNEPSMHQNHISSNYTHVVRDCETNGNAIFAHIIAKAKDDRERCYSASCNADTAMQTIREFARHQANGVKKLRIGMVNPQLPFMYGDAELSPGDYDIIIDTAEGDHTLFSTPRMPISDPDYMIGMHVSALIRDGGTLQIGIGALGDAIAYALDTRHNRNATYLELLQDSGIASTYRGMIDQIGGTDTFKHGLYGSTEMLVDGFLQLYKSGVIKRKVYHNVYVQRLINQAKIQERIPADILDLLVADEEFHPYLLCKEFESLKHCGVFKEELAYDNGHIVDGDKRYSANLGDASNRRKLAAACLGNRLKNGVCITGGFFLGPRDFYETLRAMPDKERQQFEMTGVEIANQLYGNQVLRSLQRRDGRFCNTGMKATLLGHIVSDGLEDGSIVSGVGGQYNFVAMAHAIGDGRLLMMIKSTRQEAGRTRSNIVFNYPHVTIPRHLRDIVVTEYGIADIRGKSDQEIVKAMLNVADSRFQEELLAEAKRNSRISQDYEIPDRFRNNTPQHIAGILQGYKTQGHFPPFPFGSEFSRVEMVLAHALKVLKAKSGKGSEAELAKAMKGLPDEPPEKSLPFLERMQLSKPINSAESQMQKTVLLAMRLAGVI
jgi:acyl-CoA hydrolase